MKRVTIKDIAEALRISTSTVSRALVDDHNIRTETKQLILETARKMGYRPNPVARNLKSGRSNTVGVLVPEMVTPFASCVVEGIQEILYAEGIKVIIADSREDPQRELENMKLMERFMVDGIVVSLCDYNRNIDEIKELKQRGMPMVFYDRIPKGLDVSQVIVDDYMKSFFLVERIIRSGRKHIVHIQGPDNIYNAIERLRGYREAMAKFKLDCGSEMVVRAGISYEDGMRATDFIIDRGLPCDAVFAFTDVVAIGAMNRFRERGKKIPEEIAVASFSGTELSKMVYPPLTTVEPPLKMMGRTAAQLILERIRNFESPRRSVVLNAEIVMRESTGTPGEM